MLGQGLPIQALPENVTFLSQINQTNQTGAADWVVVYHHPYYYHPIYHPVYHPYYPSYHPYHPYYPRYYR